MRVERIYSYRTGFLCALVRALHFSLADFHFLGILGAHVGRFRLVCAYLWDV